MSASITAVAPRYLSTVYDGTNGTDVVAAIPGATLAADTGTLLTVSVNWQSFDLAVSDVIVWRQSGANASSVMAMAPADFADLFAAV